MVVNMVLLLECVGTSRQRLLVATVNGWPLGMMTMAAVGYCTAHWCVLRHYANESSTRRSYHITLAVMALVCLPLLYVTCRESARWLHGKGGHPMTVTTMAGDTKSALYTLEYCARVNQRALNMQLLYERLTRADDGCEMMAGEGKPSAKECSPTTSTHRVFVTYRTPTVTYRNTWQAHVHGPHASRLGGAPSGRPDRLLVRLVCRFVVQLLM